MKVKHTEIYNGVLVVRGVFKMIECDSDDGITKSDGINYQPFIISETEPIEVGCLCINLEPINSRDAIIYQATATTALWKDSRRVLVSTENFSPEQLRMIIEGDLKDGDNVMVLCTDRVTCTEGAECPTITGGYFPCRGQVIDYTRIKFTADNYITLIEKLTQENMLDGLIRQHKEEITDEWGALELLEYLKLNGYVLTKTTKA